MSESFTGLVKNPTEQELVSKVEPVLETLGYSLRDLIILGSGSSSTVRITLDKASAVAPVASVNADTSVATDNADAEIAQPTGDEIGIEDCSRAHQILNPLFDVWDPLPGMYTLEVSSPGEKPTLRTPAHFLAARGQKVLVQTTEALPMPPPARPRRNWEGVLSQIDTDGNRIQISDSSGEYWLEMKQIRSATWLREWAMPGAQKPAKGALPGKKKFKEKS